jgi:hypothetical protein
MSERFHDWLDECPVQWFRTQPKVGDGYVEYNFKIDTGDGEYHGE